MALVTGTNSGFVLARPTVDPDEGGATFDNYNHAFKATAPIDAAAINEIGFYVCNASEAADCRVALYSHNAGDDKPNAIIKVSDAFAKGTTSGWKYTALAQAITGGTIYWLGVEIANTATGTEVDVRGDAGYRLFEDAGTFADPWDTSNLDLRIGAIYAVYTAAGGSIVPQAMHHYKMQRRGF